MASISSLPLFFSLFLLLTSLYLSNAKPATFLDDFKITWSENHIKQMENGTAIQLLLDQSSGINETSHFSLVVLLKIKVPLVVGFHFLLQFF